MAPPAVRKNSIGILPPGALGVTLFYHLTGALREVTGDVFFLERPGSTSGAALRESGGLRIIDASGSHVVETAKGFGGDLAARLRERTLPEVLLICPNPDQLLEVITAAVELLEAMHQAAPLVAGDLDFPILVLSANGIYFQRVRQVFIEKLEESTLFGRLPDLWPELMPEIVSHLLRGVTMQTGLREGSGAGTTYRPGPAALTRIAGGSARLRQRAVEILTGRGGWYEDAADGSPTRIEFDKGLVNITCNLLGQIQAIDDAGNFRALNVGEILGGENEAEAARLTAHVVAVGRAVKVYSADETSERVLETMYGTSRLHRGHVPSSLQWVKLMLEHGTLAPQVTPTEIWLLDPLIRYARSAQLEDSALYFESLKERLVTKLRLCAAAQSAVAQANH